MVKRLQSPRMNLLVKNALEVSCAENCMRAVHQQLQAYTADRVAVRFQKDRLTVKNTIPGNGGSGFQAVKYNLRGKKIYKRCRNPRTSAQLGSVPGENLWPPETQEAWDFVIKDMYDSLNPDTIQELLQDVDFNQVPTPTLEPMTMATDGDGLEASMGRLSLGGEASRSETDAESQHNSSGSEEAVIKVEDESAHISNRGSFDDSTSVYNSKTSDRLGTAMYALVCWLTKELVSKCSTKTLTRLVAEMIPICDLHGNNALHVAVRHPPHLLDLLLKILANTKKYSACINKQNDGGQTSLHVAAQSGRHDLVMILLDCSADVALVDRRGRTALHCGVLGSLPRGTLKAIVSQPQLQLNAADKQGKTALHLAVEKKDPRALETLCQAGLDANAAVGGTGDGPLHLAVVADFVKGVNILLKQETIQVASINSYGMDALELALDMKREAIMELLCAHSETLKSQPGGDINNPEKVLTNAGTEPERAEGGRRVVSLRSRVVTVLESEDNATRVLKLLEDGKDTVVEKMIALLRVSGLGETIYHKYLQDHDDDSLRRLFVDVLQIPLD